MKRQPYRASGAWLPRRRAARVEPVGKIEPGVTFCITTPGWDVFDRATGEYLGNIWRSGFNTWSITLPVADGEPIVLSGLHGSRHDVGMRLLPRQHTGTSTD
jgi:hypothetical protein